MVSFVSRRYMRGENGKYRKYIQIGKQNGEIIDVKVKIEKSKNELFQISSMLIYLGCF